MDRRCGNVSLSFMVHSVQFGFKGLEDVFSYVNYIVRICVIWALNITLAFHKWLDFVVDLVVG